MSISNSSIDISKPGRMGPSSSLGRNSGTRASVARLINADADEIVLTSGATEANNLALKGALP